MAIKQSIRCCLFLLCILLVCNLFLQKKAKPDNGPAEVTSQAGFVVSVEEANGVFFYDPEALLPMLAATILAGEQGEELIRAVTVLCRTNLVYAWEQAGRPQILPIENTVLTVCSRARYRNFFAKIYGQETLVQAAADTQGIVLTYEGDQIIEAPFFYLSAGYTRQADDSRIQGTVGFLQSKECPQDLKHEGFLAISEVKQKEFETKMTELLETSGIMLTKNRKMQELFHEIEWERDEQGYVTQIRYTGQEAEDFLEVNAFCEMFSLHSPCFDWELRDESIVFRTKGIGHGVGFGVCYAAWLSENGMPYDDILQFFYTGVKLDKRYN